MTSIFDRLSAMAKEDRPRFEKIALKIIDYIMIKVNHDEHWQILDFIYQVTDHDCKTPDRFIDYLSKLSRLVKGGDFLSGYQFLDWGWADDNNDFDFLKDFIDSFHDYAHGFAHKGWIKSDALMFGYDILKLVLE